VEVVGADHGGNAMLAGGAGLLALLRCKRRKKKASWGEWAKRPDGSAGCWAES
jgi:hypothetical protein